MSNENTTPGSISTVPGSAGLAGGNGATHPVPAQLLELLQQALETELGAVNVYERALTCLTDRTLEADLSRYLTQTLRHVRILEELMARFGLDALALERGRSVVRHKCEALVEAMDLGVAVGASDLSQLVAIECVVDVATKDNLNWVLLCAMADRLDADVRDAVKHACDAVGDEGDEHLQSCAGWARELWLKHLGLDAMVPPPEGSHGRTTTVGGQQRI